MIHTVATSALYWLIPLILAVIKLVCLLVAIAYYTHAERKLMASFQRRSGPNVVGLFGLLQPLADGLKLAGKEFVTPTYSNSRIFIASAMATLMLALVSGTAIPLNLVDASVGLKASTLAELIAPSSEFILKYAQLVREYGKPCWAPAHSYLSGQEFTEATKDVDGGLGQHDWLLFADAFLKHPGFGDDWTPEQRAHGGRCYRVISYNFGREIGSLADETDCFECQL